MMKLLIFLVLIAGIYAQTTLHFPEIFMGKCFEKNPRGTDCYSLYGNFSNAAMTDNSLQTDALYDPFFALANFSTPESSILFWSGNMAFALAISSNDPRFVTVEETSTGFVLNGLSWCGTPEHTFDYANPCYYLTNSTYYGSQGVWSRASTMFAQGASGDIYVLLQPASIGGTPPVYQAYRNTSIFAAIELPAMRVSHVKSITVLLLKNTTLAPEEKCGHGSMLVMEDAVKTKFNFSLTCVDDPTLIYTMLCPPHTASAQCLAATLVYTYEIEEKAGNYLVWAISTTVVAGILLIIAFVLTVKVVTSRRGYEPLKSELHPPSNRKHY